MFLKMKEQFFGWLYFVLFVFLFSFFFFGRDIYELYFKPSELEIYMEAYKKTYGEDFVIPEHLKDVIKK